MTSQPETELNGGEELNEDAAILEQLARKREQASQEGQEVDEEQEEAEVEAQEEAENEESAPVVEEDPEIDLGDIKVKKSELKAGYMKDADYRQKTAEVAEAKRNAQALQDRVEQERNHYANQLDTLISQLQTQLVGDQQVLAELAATDPAEWVRQNAAYQQRFQRFQQALGERQVIEQRAREEKDRKRNDWIRSNSEALHAKLPEWKDPAARTRELDEMAAYLRQQGVSEEDMETFMDHRVYLIARKAWLAEKQQAARVAAKDKQVKQPPPKPLKAGAAQTETKVSDALAEAQKRAKSGREEDILHLMAVKRRIAQ